MTEQEYFEIAAACDRLLRASDTSIARIAIPALHVINEHPNCTSVYDPSLHTLSAWEDPPRAALRAARAVIRASLRNRPRQPIASTPIDILIVSHLVNPTQWQQEEDPYFGPLQRVLGEHGVTSMLALVNHRTNRPIEEQATGFARILLPDYAPPAIEAHLWLQSFRARNALRATARAAGHPVDRTMAMMASRHAWLAPTVANLRLHWSIAEICATYRPKMVLTTYEGEACERLIWHAARSAGKRPLCVGYQHANILQRAHAIRRPLAVKGLDCDPDVVLTAGEISHASLASSPALAALQLIPYGTHRKTHIQQRVNPPAANTCLVLPDAAPAECALLFEFAGECARLLPAMSFRLRPHPATDLQSLRLTPPPANATLSVDTTLAEDCSSASYCLYRGSSAVVPAVMAGIKPFYVQRQHELPFDPIAGIPGWRETICTPGEFAARVQATPKHPDRAQQQAAADFCRRYTAPLKPEALTQLLETRVPVTHG